MKITLTVELKKTDGKTCDDFEVFQALEEEIDSLVLYPQAEDADEESSYEVTNVTMVMEK